MDLFFDGYCRKNPGVVGGGRVTDSTGNVLGELERAWEGMTCNQAEAIALYLACRLATPGATLRGDSQLIIRRATGVSKKKNKKTQRWDELVSHSLPLIQSKQLQLEWVPREQNLAGIENERRQ